MAKPFDEFQFVISAHELYARYQDDWRLAIKSYYGGPEYRMGEYLKQFDSDNNTPSEVVNTYDVDDNGVTQGVYRTSVTPVNTSQEANEGLSYASNFYQEKLLNVPVLPYTRLYVQEYNAILMKNTPYRILPLSPEINSFSQNVDGEQNSLNEFFSHVDVMSTIFGVTWMSCIKPTGSDLPRWRYHTPLDVTNWQFAYSMSGDLVLKKIVIKTASEAEFDVYQYMTPESIDTYFIIKEGVDYEEFDISQYIDAEEIEEGDGHYVVRQENELGYVPCVPLYTGTKIHNGVGHSIIFDIAGIQKNIYAAYGDLYAVQSYGSHPVTVVDTETSDLNDNSIGAEPGSVIRVNSSLSGEPQYVFEFRAPPLDSMVQLREYVNQLIEKMNQVAMVRSDELIKASRSGVQIEMFDSKLEAMIRRKATAMENAEYNLWKIWFDWMDKPMPEDFSIQYNKSFSQRGLEQEIKELEGIMNMLETYNNKFTTGVKQFVVEDYPTQEQAEAVAESMGGSGSHSHTREDGLITYMPFTTHLDYEMALEKANPGTDFVEEDPDFEKDLKEKIRERMKALIDQTYSSNSL
jgi:hypothetical protein